MSFQILAIVAIMFLGMSQPPPHARTRAKATITVQSSESTPYDQTSGPALVELHLHETFVGDIVGDSPVRALQVLRDDHSASLVSVQRFRGTLGGRQGTFVLQGSEIVEHGNIKGDLVRRPGIRNRRSLRPAWRGRL